MKPTRILVRVIENGYIIAADYPTGEKNKYDAIITVLKEYVAYDGDDLDRLIAEIRSGELE